MTRDRRRSFAIEPRARSPRPIGRSPSLEGDLDGSARRARSHADARRRAGPTARTRRGSSARPSRAGAATRKRTRHAVRMRHQIVEAGPRMHTNRDVDVAMVRRALRAAVSRHRANEKLGRTVTPARVSNLTSRSTDERSSATIVGSATADRKPHSYFNSAFNTVGGGCGEIGKCTLISMTWYPGVEDQWTGNGQRARA